MWTGEAFLARWAQGRVREALQTTGSADTNSHVSWQVAGLGAVTTAPLVQESPGWPNSPPSARAEEGQLVAAKAAAFFLTKTMRIQKGYLKRRPQAL